MPSPSSVTKPVSTSTGSPEGFPSRNGTKITSHIAIWQHVKPARMIQATSERDNRGAFGGHRGGRWRPPFRLHDVDRRNPRSSRGGQDRVCAEAYDIGRSCRQSGCREYDGNRGSPGDPADELSWNSKFHNPRSRLTVHRKQDARRYGASPCSAWPGKHGPWMDANLHNQFRLTHSTGGT